MDQLIDLQFVYKVKYYRRLVNPLCQKFYGMGFGWRGVTKSRKATKFPSQPTHDND